MKIIIDRSTARRVIRWTRRGLFACAFILLSYWIFVSADTWMFQREAKAEMSKPSPATDHPTAHTGPEDGELIGRVDVARLGVSVAVVEGSDTTMLSRAAGHIPGTAMPGEKGNTAIAAHRDTFFRPLRNVRPKDVIRVTTRGGVYRYRVVSTKVVQPEDVSVLNSDGSEELTLVTCYPFFFVGAAPKRFIVKAVRLSGDNGQMQSDLQPETVPAHLYY